MPIKERRQGPDKWVFVTRLLTVFAWLVFILAIILSYYAAPEIEYGIVRYHQLEVRKLWHIPLTGYLYVMLLGCAFISYFCIIINHYRGRRADDGYNFNATLLLLLTIVWALYIVFDVTF